MLHEFADRLSRFGTSSGEVRERLLRTRSQDVPWYLDALIDGFPWEDVAVVGFTSTFQQSAASFALAGG